MRSALTTVVGGVVAVAALLACGAALAAEADVEKIPSCQFCGMDRAKFAPTRVLIEYEDGSVTGTCSIHCAAIDLAQSIGKTVQAIQVADYPSGRLADAEKAAWVVGAGIPGVMARKSRVAFADRAAAEGFQREKGGEVADFNAALSSTYCDMAEDVKMIREKRAKMRAESKGK